MLERFSETELGGQGHELNGHRCPCPRHGHRCGMDTKIWKNRCTPNSAQKLRPLRFILPFDFSP